jgi:toxin ParE1/3/4
MRIEYSRRAVEDIRKMADDSIRFGAGVAAAAEQRLGKLVQLIESNPLAAPRVEARPGVHVLPLTPYPYRIFYRVHVDRVVILHVRHTARRPWPTPNPTGRDD